ncbi:SdpI family protein [Ligilactobacillus pobuzihii]|uniref:DUF1648 domain-containing protein n=1 Tax=Ligilactobacillus pobuzihii TaxID=449659 RepID=A0A0R2L9K5_9LACO|nr:SdpI family protein [Ligilactobacillus pobuzihii]KRK09055.1 hypothetical protein FD11_GL001402 [Ligilactobacillus pobuzihii E100301 = KCTC 13174]KRN95802.1 hypothetical protein IV66_GL000822 [Ligilactobacillus pobuzihii]GEN49162.1 hemolysin expression modulating protein [Ligilactobacillus pobuzihii]
MKKDKEIKTIVGSFLLTLVPMIVGILLWNKLPNQIATHFTLHSGQPNGWSSKAMAVYGFPLAMAAVQLFVVVFMNLDKYKRNIGSKVIKVIYWIVPWVEFVTVIMIFGYSLGYQINSDVVSNLLLGVVFIVLGSYLPKVKQNKTIGYRVSWTLNSQENWQKTNRLGGWIFVICGVIFLANTLLQQEWLIIVSLIIAVVIPLMYSYALHRKGI